MEIEDEILKAVLEDTIRMYEQKIKSMNGTIEYYGEQLGKAYSQLERIEENATQQKKMRKRELKN